MSAGEISPPVAPRHLAHSAWGDRAARGTAARVAGTAALVAAAGGSLWIAAGAAQGSYLLDLPTRSRPAWIEGPLHGLGSWLGGLGPSSLSLALVVLLCAYVIAGLTGICAGSSSARPGSTSQ